MLAAPLIISQDLMRTKEEPFVMETLLNREVIAVDQDALGNDDGGGGGGGGVGGGDDDGGGGGGGGVGGGDDDGDDVDNNTINSHDATLH
jgi:hypothetical protein